MLIITSPAKTLDQNSIYPKTEITQPLFLEKTNEIAQKLKKLPKKELQKMYQISDKLVELNHQRLKDWTKKHDLKNSRPAIFMYFGDIYREIFPKEYNKSEQDYAQKSLRMITGLYGYLRPFDLIQPYRLEMRTNVPSIGWLHDYWQQTLTESLNQEAETQKHPFLLDLASKEYSKSINFNNLNIPRIEVLFKEKRDGKLKTIAIFSKKARGMMIEFCIKNQINTVEQIKKFNTAGYKFTEETPNSLLFTR